MQIFPNSARLKFGALTLVALALGGVVAVAPSTASFAADDDTIGLSGAPLTDPNTSPRTRFSYQMSPGQRVDDAYVVTNSGSLPQTFTLFATDAFNSEDGGYGLLDTGIEPSDAGSWVTFDGGATQLDLALQPGESRSVPFVVSAPADASPGDHAAGLVISALSPDGQVLVDRRVGTRVYVRVPGDLQPNLTISSIVSSYTPAWNPFDGTSTVTYTVRNAGNVALAANTTVQVKALFGIGVGDTVKKELAEMLPGSTRTVSIEVKGVGQWIYLNPTVTLAPVVDADALNPGPLSIVSRDTVTFIVPWALLAAIVLALAIWGWLKFSRARNDRRAQEWIDYTESEARRKATAGASGSGIAVAGAGS